MGAHGVCTLTSKHQSYLTRGGCSNTCRWLLWVIGQPLPASFGRRSPGLAMPGAEGGDASVSSRHAELVPCSTQVSLGCWQTQLPFKVMRNSSSVCVLQKKDWSPREKGVKTQFLGLFDTYFSSSLASRSCEAAIRASIRAISIWRHMASSMLLLLPAPKMGTLSEKPSMRLLWHLGPFS